MGRGGPCWVSRSPVSSQAVSSSRSATGGSDWGGGGLNLVGGSDWGGDGLDLASSIMLVRLSRGWVWDGACGTVSLSTGSEGMCSRGGPLAGRGSVALSSSGSLVSGSISGGSSDGGSLGGGEGGREGGGEGGGESGGGMWNMCGFSCASSAVFTNVLFSSCGKLSPSFGPAVSLSV